MVRLRIDEETLEFWSKQAAMRGLSLEDWLKSTTVGQAGGNESEFEIQPDFDERITDETWHDRLLEFAKRHRPTGRALDDSRESIYD